MHKKSRLKIPFDKFVNFLIFKEDNLYEWVTDRKSEQKMIAFFQKKFNFNVLEENEHSNENVSEDEYLNENFISLYLFKTWKKQPESVVKQFLLAYLQESCYWAVESIYKAIKHQTKSVGAYCKYSLRDCFYMGIDKTYKVLEKFSIGKSLTLKSYAKKRFWTLLRDELRERRETNICTDWSLLRKLNPGRIKKNLKNRGYCESSIAQYILAWQCFVEIYVPNQGNSTTRLNEPRPNTWKEIATLYNTRRMHCLNSPGSECQPETIKQWLIDCVRIEREHYHIKNEKLFNFGDELSLPNDVLEVSERLEVDSIFLKEQAPVIETFLKRTLNNLKPEQQQLLSLYYGREKISQAKIGEQFGMKQYQVARKLKQIISQMTIALSKWSKDQLNITLTSERLNDISELLKCWLIEYFSQNSPVQ